MSKICQRWKVRKINPRSRSRIGPVPKSTRFQLTDRVSRKSVNNFLSNIVNRHTDRQTNQPTNKVENITSLGVGNYNGGVATSQPSVLCDCMTQQVTFSGQMNLLTTCSCSCPCLSHASFSTAADNHCVTYWLPAPLNAVWRYGTGNGYVCWYRLFAIRKT